MGDLISRQAAIDALRKDPMGGLNYESILGSLPPAQPEDCSTCKHGHFGDRQCDYCRVRYPSHYEREEEQHGPD